MVDYAEYARQLRHELHRCPEIGFDLPQTTAIVRRELDAMGVPYTEEYCKGSIVATINPGKPFTIGLRGDMDALPIKENSSNPYPSKNDGQMHACGHDVHTAQMVAVARQLNDMKEELHCTVKVLFTPAEEYVTPGCKEMADNGVMDDIDMIIACHVDPTVPIGQVHVREGGANANSLGMFVEFFGKPSHAALQHQGVDAIRMAVEAYIAMELMIAREVAGKSPCILNIGAFNGGITNNIVCDYVKLFLTNRTHSDELTEFVERRIHEICENVAKTAGGKAVVTRAKLLPYVNNHSQVSKLVISAAQKVVGKEKVKEQNRTMGGEDFSFLTRMKPGCMFRLGINNPTIPGTQVSLHNDHFDVDERCFDIGIPVFVNFVLDNQDGLPLDPVEIV